MHSAIDHDCTLNARFGKPSCMTDFVQEIREDERERTVQRLEALQIHWRDAHFGTDHLVASEWNEALTMAIAAIEGDHR